MKGVGDECGACASVQDVSEVLPGEIGSSAATTNYHSTPPPAQL